MKLRQFGTMWLLSVADDDGLWRFIPHNDDPIDVYVETDKHSKRGTASPPKNMKGVIDVGRDWLLENLPEPQRTEFVLALQDL